MTRVYTRRATVPAVERIALKTIQADHGYETPCSVWTGAKGWNGYGVITTGSKTDGTRRPARVHRVVWEHHHGPIPSGKQLHHLCGNPPCVNPEHLEMVAVSEHVRRHAATITHCPQGHPYAGDNLYINPSGARVCRTCQRAACRRSYRRNHRKAAA